MADISDQANFEEITDFIVSLAQDPQKARAFRKDPETYLQASDIGDDTKALIRSGQQGIYEHLGPTQFASRGSNIVVVIIVVVVV